MNFIKGSYLLEPPTHLISVFYFSGITIGFEQSTYTAQEAPQATVATICVDILEGSAQRNVEFTFVPMPGSAGTRMGCCGE